MNIIKSLLQICAIIILPGNDEAQDHDSDTEAGRHSFTRDLHKSIPVDPNDPSKGRWMS